VVIPRAAESDILERVRQVKRGTTCIGEVLPPPLWSQLAPSAVSDAVSTRIRAAFDPQRHLNRGILGDA
jgi:hypothetical protein